MSDLIELLESGKSGHGQEDQWISLSDLMTTLMLVFMLLAIAYMLKTEANSKAVEQYSEQMRQSAEKMQESAEKIKEIAVIYEKMKVEIYNDITKEFQNDFTAWGATIDPDLSIRFNNEYIMFDRGKDELKYSFKTILQNFFPRYLKILTSAKYRDSINEVRIEGHTSSLWAEGTPPQEAYFRNMELSQARTRSVLRYVMELPDVQQEVSWLRQYVTANGLSSAHLVLNPDNTENEALSQRVEFRIRTDAESKIKKILESVE